MGKINLGRVILGGFVGGIVTNLIDMVVNVPVLGAAWKAETDALHLTHMTSAGMSACGWIVSDFLITWIAVWLYAGIRPRFGPGPGTAIKAGLAVWALTGIAYSAFAFNGLYSQSLTLQSSLGGLVAKVAGTWLGAMIYKENA